MSMTREEAAHILEYSRIVSENFTQEAVTATYVMALAALRGPTREQVEKMWRGCEKCNGAGEYSRYAENLTKILLAKYCPHCGRPLTDEAVDMVMERLEALRDEKG